MISSILLKSIQKTFAYRGDGAPQLRYFFAREYGVSTEDFSFRSGRWLLRGKKHFVPGVKPKAIVVFFHGLGAGYTAYTQEICAIAKQGYLVYAYDNTGCMTSEGQTIGCLCQSLLDQKAFFDYLDQNDHTGLPRFAVGHSWGGFTALGALQEEYRVSKVVSISGFFYLPTVFTMAEKRLEKMESFLVRALKKGYGKYGVMNMVDLIANTKASVLYIQGEADPVIIKSKHYDVLQQCVAKKENVKLLLVKDAAHNPYWTLEAQKYFMDIQKGPRLPMVDFDNAFAVDYGKLNQDEPKVMKEIFDFLGA